MTKLGQFIPYTPKIYPNTQEVDLVVINKLCTMIKLYYKRKSIYGNISVSSSISSGSPIRGYVSTGFQWHTLRFSVRIPRLGRGAIFLFALLEEFLPPPQLILYEIYQLLSLFGLHESNHSTSKARGRGLVPSLII